jgi:hypothetical protein
MWNQLFHMFIKWLGPTKKQFFFLLIISTMGSPNKPIDNCNNVPISLCNVYHESFEVGFNDSIFEHEPIEFCP